MEGYAFAPPPPLGVCLALSLCFSPPPRYLHYISGRKLMPPTGSSHLQSSHPIPPCSHRGKRVPRPPPPEICTSDLLSNPIVETAVSIDAVQLFLILKREGRGLGPRTIDTKHFTKTRTSRLSLPRVFKRPRLLPPPPPAKLHASSTVISSLLFPVALASPRLTTHPPTHPHSTGLFFNRVFFFGLFCISFR